MADGLTLDDLEKDLRDNFLGKDFDENKLDEPFELHWRFVRDFSWGISDENPLFCDPKYGPKTRWGSQLAVPTICASIRYPQSHAAVWDKPYPSTNLVAGCSFEWFNVFRAGDKVTSSLKITDIERKVGKSGPLIFATTKGEMWNQKGELVVIQSAAQVQVEMQKGAERGEKLVYEQPAYRYSKEEIKKIVDCYDAETIRGAKPLYWEDVKVGDKLPTTVRGPLTLGDMIMYHAKSYPTGPVQGAFRRSLKCARMAPPFSLRTNPQTDWPWEDMMWEHYDVNLARTRNMPLPFDFGAMRYEMAAVLLTNWMGDDGFLKKLYVQIRRPVFYGDTTWFSGEVVNKEKVTEGGVEYGAVEIKIEGVNQKGDSTTPGTATVYLPSSGREVQIPIPGTKPK